MFGVDAIEEPETPHNNPDDDLELVAFDYLPRPHEVIALTKCINCVNPLTLFNLEIDYDNFRGDDVHYIRCRICTGTLVSFSMDTSTEEQTNRAKLNGLQWGNYNPYIIYNPIPLDDFWL